MTDSEIIKALECCSIKHDCNEYLYKLVKEYEKGRRGEMKYIEYPIKVNKINCSEPYSLYKMGGFARVRPCGEEYENKTYLGLFLGELPTSSYVTYNTESEELNVGMICNPAIYVFDLNKIIYGYESWWSRIKSEDDLKDITDIDINKQWYVKALQYLQDHPTEKGGVQK